MGESTYKFKVINNSLVFDEGGDHELASGIINISSSIGGELRLLDFLNEVLKGQNLGDTYWSEVYAAQLVEKEGRKQIRIFGHMYNDKSEQYIEIEELKMLVEAFIKEREEFKKNPEGYKEELKKRGGQVEET